jgi:hypothetical protein
MIMAEAAPPRSAARREAGAFLFDRIGGGRSGPIVATISSECIRNVFKAHSV